MWPKFDEKKTSVTIHKLVKINKFLKSFVFSKKSSRTLLKLKHWLHELQIRYEHFHKKKWETLSNFLSESIIKTKEINLKIFFTNKGGKVFFKSSHGILPFLDLFQSQTPCSSLSFHHRIKTKPDLESLCKTVWMSYFQ